MTDMDDRDLETMLGRYRPAAADAGLKGRVLGPAAATGRTWPWAVAAAALLAMSLGLHMNASRGMAKMQAGLPPDERAVALQGLAEKLGGTAASRELAEQLIVEEEHRARREDGPFSGSQR